MGRAWTAAGDGLGGCRLALLSRKGRAGKVVAARPHDRLGPSCFLSCSVQGYICVELACRVFWGCSGWGPLSCFQGTNSYSSEGNYNQWARTLSSRHQAGGQGPVQCVPCVPCSSTEGAQSGPSRRGSAVPSSTRTVGPGLLGWQLPGLDSLCAIKNPVSNANAWVVADTHYLLPPMGSNCPTLSTH